MIPKHFAVVAMEVRKLQCDADAKSRTAIGRAYYAAYHAAREALAAFGYRQPRNSDGHQWTYRVLSGSENEELRTLGGDLSDLAELRRIADYELDARPKVESKSNVDTAVETAFGIITDLGRLAGSHDRESLAASMSRSAETFDRFSRR